MFECQFGNPNGNFKNKCPVWRSASVSNNKRTARGLSSEDRFFAVDLFL
jgi:hypothetical protein